MKGYEFRVDDQVPINGHEILRCMTSKDFRSGKSAFSGGAGDFVH